MKTMWCTECGHQEKNSSDTEIMANMWKHIERDHPSLAVEISNLSEDEQEKRLQEEVQEMG